MSQTIKFGWIYVNPTTKTYSCRPCEFLGQTERRLARYSLDAYGWFPDPDPEDL